MRKPPLVTLLNSLWAGKINKLDFNLYSMTISLSITTIENKNEILHNLIFEGVKAFFYVDQQKGYSRKLVPWENIELSEVHYLQNKNDSIQHIQKTNDGQQYSANPNFFLEIWSDAFFIEAKTIIFDDLIYELG